jgi:hypothetical protein
MDRLGRISRPNQTVGHKVRIAHKRANEVDTCREKEGTRVRQEKGERNKEKKTYKG